MGKCGIVDWFPVGGAMLWFQDTKTNAAFTGNEIMSITESPSIQVPSAMVERTQLSKTLQFTKERGYDVKPGDVESVARGPECQTKGIVQSVDFLNARLTLISESDHSLVSTTAPYRTSLTCDRSMFPLDS